MSSQNAGPSTQGTARAPTPTGNTPTTQAGTGTATSTQSRSAQIHYEIPILEDADGFTHWHFCMKLALRDSDLLSVVDGTLPKPNVATDLDTYVVFCRARLGSKAPAWARLGRARAHKNLEPGLGQWLGLGWAGLGLKPGLQGKK